MKRFGVLFALLILILLACGPNIPIPENKEVSATPGSKKVASTQPAAKTTIENLSTPSGVKMGDIVRCEECGFSFKQIPGYKISTFGMIEDIATPDADADAGPRIQLIGGAAKPGLTATVLMASVKALNNDSPGFTLSNQKNIKVGGVDAVSFDVKYTINNIAVKGRRVGMLVKSKQILMMFGVAPVDKWDKMSPYVDALVNSISFFDPKPSSS